MAYVDGTGSSTSCRSPVLTGWPSRAPTTGAVSQSQPGGMYYGLPAYHSQPPPEADMTSSSRLDFLYDRPSTYASPEQQQQQQQIPAAGITRQNSRGGNSAPYAQQNGFARPVLENFANDVPPPLPSSLPPDCDPSYRPMTSRAMPAPMFQHNHQQPVAAAHPTASHNNNWNGTNSLGARQGATAAMPVDCQPNGQLRSPTQMSPAAIDHQMSRLAVSSDRHPPPAPGGVVPMSSRNGTGNRDAASGGNRSTTTRTLPMSYARRLSAPGPGGEMPTSGRNNGVRKQWAITPCGFTNTRGAQQQLNSGRTTPVDGSSRNGLCSPQVTAPRTADGPKLFIPSSPGGDVPQRQRYASQDSTIDDGNYYTNSSTVDRSSIRQNLREGDEVGEYEQTSIRYTGKANPSKMFRLLQTATGSDTETDVKLAQAALSRQARRRRPTCEEIDDCSSERRIGDSSDDIVDISYVGSKIPSRTFRCLQEVLGSRDPRDNASLGLPPPGVIESMEPDQTTPYCRNVKVIHLRPANMKKHSSMDNILCDGYTDL